MAAKKTKYFDPDLVQLLFAGIPIEGYAEGSMIEWEWSEEAFKIVKGTDGTISRSKVVGRFLTVTIHLMQTSRSNAVLTGIHTQDLISPGGAGVSPYLLRDGNGVSLQASDESWINGFPAGGYGDQAGPRDWKLTVVDPAVVEGGT